MNRKDRRGQHKIMKSMTTSFSTEIDHMVDRALALHKSKNFSAAAQVYEHVLKLQPNHVATLCFYGLLQESVGDFKKAINYLTKAISLNGQDATLYYNLGCVYRAIFEFSLAVKNFEKAVALKPSYVEALVNLGVCNYDIGKFDLAEQFCRRAIEISSWHLEANNNLAATMKELGRPEEAIAIYQELLKHYPNSHVIHSNLLMHLHYDLKQTQRSLYEAHLDWAVKYGQENIERLYKTLDKNPRKRLKIGYVSADLRRHPVGYFIDNVLRDIDKEQFSIYCYDNGKTRDDLTERLKSYSNMWRVIYGLEDDVVANMIINDGIDILIDLSGHTGSTRINLFTKKLAPLQVSWIGYFNTTGLASIDYVLTDKVHSPIGADQWFTEKLYRLPNCYLCYSPPEFAPEPASTIPVEKNGFITFGCFNHVAKLNEQVIKAWAEILTEVKNSQLFIKLKIPNIDIIKGEIINRFARYNITSERIRIVGWSPHKEMLAQYNEIDIALDPFPFPGGLTSCEALWMGVPVVTYAGELMVSRQTCTYLHAIGFDELVANSVQQYQELAVKLASDLPKLKQIKSTLRMRMQASVLIDSKIFAQDLGKAYREMWENYCQGAA
jgi:predicted O-linked N-acetylglucosamine transferase (SPINDLY family)